MGCYARLRRGGAEFRRGFEKSFNFMLNTCGVGYDL